MKKLDKNRVLVAMSGGVDSSVAALLMKEAGYEVFGVSLKLFAPMARGEARSKSCCSTDEIDSAQIVCEALGIPFYRVNRQSSFHDQVMQYFASEYVQGRTPNPCVACNQHIKFPKLLDLASEMGAYYVATGHYIRREAQVASYTLHQADDLQKDQSYFLYSLNQKQLKHLLFPLGTYTKDQVRALARRANLPTADRPESQEVCFVPASGHAEFIEQYFPNMAPLPGAFVDSEGEWLGTHQGIHGYTPGQRKGLGIAAGERLYVSKIDRETQEISLGLKSEILKEGLVADRVTWISGKIPTGEISVKIRYRHESRAAVLTMIEDNKVQVKFATPDGAVCPGQSVVFYEGRKLLGGGVIERAL